MVAPAVETTRCICAVGGGRFKLVVLQCVAASFGGVDEGWFVQHVPLARSNFLPWVPWILLNA